MNLLSYITQMGVTDKIHERDLRFISTINFGVCLGVVLVALISILSWSNGHWLVMRTNLWMVLAYLLMVVLCIRGQHIVAGTLAHFVLVVMVFVQARLHGEASDTHMWLLLIPVVACVCYPPAYWFHALFWSLISIGLVSYFEALNLPTFLAMDPEATHRNTAISNGLLGAGLLAVSFYSRRLLVVSDAKLRAERARSDRLLHNILPHSIVKLLKEQDGVIADSIDSCSVLFSDIVGFTKLSQTMSAGELVSMLNELFSAFDDLCEKHGVEKIKTIGDAYMVAAGIPAHRSDHAQVLVQLGLDMQDVLRKFHVPLDIRIGIHSGPVVAGVIGKRKFAYDLWGDTVNTASRMESHGVPGKIQISEATYDLLGKETEAVDRGVMDIKGKGMMRTYLISAHEQPALRLA